VAVGTGRRAGKACGQGAVPLLATQLVDITLPGDILAMVSTTVGKLLPRRAWGPRGRSHTNTRLSRSLAAGSA